VVDPAPEWRLLSPAVQQELSRAGGVSHNLAPVDFELGLFDG
jgi:hypothetical protein